MKYLKLYDYFREISWVNVAQWMIVCGIFTERYYELAILLLVTLLNIIILRRFEGGWKILLMMLGLLIYSSITLAVYHYSPEKFVQQYLLLFFTLMFYHSFFHLNVPDLKALFRKYLYIAYIVALLGVIQAIVYYFSEINIFSFLYGRIDVLVSPKILRITSIVDEPSYLSTLLTPAVAYYLLLDKTEPVDNKFRKYITYLCVFLTFSTITYFIVILILLYKYLIYKKSLVVKVLVSILIIGGIGSFTYLLSMDVPGSQQGLFSEISMKLRETTGAITDMEVDSFEDLNMSSYATLTNFWVALHAPGRIFGTGLGTHEQNYYSTYLSMSPLYGTNAMEGYSLFNRILSEFGMIGIFSVILIFCLWYNKNSRINICVMFIILTFLIRGGHYTRYGTIFFFFLYYYSSDIAFRLKSKMIKDKPVLSD